jgi:hypothetical protein
MLRVLGFVLGVFVTLIGAYWLLGAEHLPWVPDAGVSPMIAARAPAGRELVEGGGREPSRAAHGAPSESDTRAGETEVARLPAPEGPADAEPDRPAPASDREPGAKPAAQEASGVALEKERTIAETVPSANPFPETEAPRAPLEAGGPREIGASVQVSGGKPEEPSTEGGEGPDSLRFVFWSPFRSERAAQGFADRLTLATAIEVEVVRLGGSRYRVAFDYRDEAERRAAVDRIEQITGLDLSEGGLP